MEHFIYFFVHIDKYLVPFVAHYGMWSYLVLFAVIFCETGLIVTPFLPGDSLLFAVGSLAGHSASNLNILMLLFLLILASILGNQINYTVGRLIGSRIFTMDHSWFFNKHHFKKAHDFYEKHGGKTIVIARFIPIIRTFAPFVAGIGDMKSVHFTLYNVFSAVLWIASLLGLGYFFGSLPIVEDNFAMLIYGIILLSLLPSLRFLLKKGSGDMGENV